MRAAPGHLRPVDSDFDITIAFAVECVASVCASWKWLCVPLPVCVCLAQLQKSDPSLIFSTGSPVSVNVIPHYECLCVCVCVRIYYSINRFN